MGVGLKEGLGLEVGLGVGSGRGGGVKVGQAPVVHHRQG